MIVDLDPAAVTEIVLGRADIHLQVCVDTRVTCQECLFTSEEEVLKLWAPCHTAATVQGDQSLQHYDNMEVFDSIHGNPT